MTRRVWAVVAAALAVVTGCGIGADGHPRDIAAADKPFPLSSDESAAPGTTAAPGKPQVYLIYSDQVTLVGSNRDVSSLDALLRALLDGPTAQDSEKNFTSAIPLNTTLVGTKIKDKTVTITLTLDPLSPGFQGTNGPKAFAQLVFTATADRTKVTGVKFVVDGQPQGVDGAGISVRTPLTRSDFPNQNPLVGSDVKQPGGTLATTTTTSTLPPTTTTSTTVAPTTTPATT